MAARRFVLPLLLAALAPVLAAAAPADDAVATVKRTLDGAVAIARAGGSREENLAKLREAARGFLDTQAMGRRAIGDVLAAQPAPEQQEYLALFDELMVRAYLGKLLLFREPRFEYGRPQDAGAAVILPTRIVTSKDAYRVDYQMEERDGRWAATDVLVEDISLTRNYQAQFETLLRDRSFAELLDVLRTKTRTAKKEPS